MVVGFSPTSRAVTPKPSQSPPPTPVRFIAVGDAGDPVQGQRDVAARMEQVCAERGCDLVLFLGDNFYSAGVTSEYDAGFETKHENTFRNIRVPFYAALGNHDASLVLGGDGFANQAGDLEVGYHYRRDRTSDHWRMPSRYHSIKFGDVEFFAIDTNAILTEGVGISDINSINQRAWLQNGINNSTAPWKIVFGHHTYVSNGGHGNAGAYAGVPEPQGNGQNFKTFLEATMCNKADFYICGHDHDLQWLNPVAACGATQFIVSGAGSQPRALTVPTRNSVKFQTGAIFGFYWIEIVGNNLRAIVYNKDGAILHDQTVSKPITP